MGAELVPAERRTEDDARARVRAVVARQVSHRVDGFPVDAQIARPPAGCELLCGCWMGHEIGQWGSRRLIGTCSLRLSAVTNPLVLRAPDTRRSAIRRCPPGSTENAS